MRIATLPEPRVSRGGTCRMPPARAQDYNCRMKIESDAFRIPPGKKISLKQWPTLAKPAYKSQQQYQQLLAQQVEQLSALQRLHYASDRYALLLIFQAMDA